MTLYFGILLIIIGLLLLRWLSTNYQMSTMARPLIFDSFYFIAIIAILIVIFILGGIFLVFSFSVATVAIGSIFLALIIIMFLLSRRGSSIEATKKAMQKTYRIVKSAYSVNNNSLEENEDPWIPGGEGKEERFKVGSTKMKPEQDILFHTLEPRYRYIGKYDKETLISIVNEYPNIESLTNFVILFEFFEEKHPGIDIETLREQVRDTLKTLKKSDSDLYSSIKRFIKNYQY